MLTVPEFQRLLTLRPMLGQRQPCRRGLATCRSYDAQRGKFLRLYLGLRLESGLSVIFRALVAAESLVTFRLVSLFPPAELVTVSAKSFNAVAIESIITKKLGVCDPTLFVKSIYIDTSTISADKNTALVYITGGTKYSNFMGRF